MRRELRARRLCVSGARKARASAQAAQQALRLLLALRARRVAVYLEYGSELPTRALLALLQAHALRVAVPRITGPGAMHFEWLRAGTPLRRNRYGIAEPARRGARAWRREFDAIVLPLLGFDMHGNRLGTGGGYYDRWLARPRSTPRPRYLGYAYAIQQVEQIPREPWDVKLDAVITEKGTLWPTG
nr:5-formyltetrahydrofolate cyclo-ligase [Solimonas soli]